MKTEFGLNNMEILCGLYLNDFGGFRVSKLTICQEY